MNEWNDILKKLRNALNNQEVESFHILKTLFQ